MSDAVMVAIITAGASVIAQLIIGWSNHNRDEVERAVHRQKLDDRLKAIEEKLDEHNGYAGRIGQIEKDITQISKDIEYLKKGAK